MNGRPVYPVMPYLVGLQSLILADESHFTWANMVFPRTMDLGTRLCFI